MPRDPLSQYKNQLIVFNMSSLLKKCFLDQQGASGNLYCRSLFIEKPTKKKLNLRKTGTNACFITANVSLMNSRDSIKQN